MARGNSQNYYKRFYANIKAKKGTEPHFWMQRQEREDYQLLPAESRSKTNPKMICYEEKNLSGDLAKVELTQSEFDGHTIESLEVTLRDHDIQEDYVIKAGIATNMGRNVLNALLNIQDFSKKIKMSLYTNKDGYAAISINSGEEWAGFKIKYEEYKPLVRTYIGKGEKTEYDWSKVDEFFKKQYHTDLEPRFKEYAKLADLEPRTTSKFAQPEPKSDVVDHLSAIRAERAENPIVKKQEPSENEMKPDNDLPF